MGGGSGFGAGLVVRGAGFVTGGATAVLCDAGGAGDFVGAGDDLGLEDGDGDWNGRDTGARDAAGPALTCC